MLSHAESTMYINRFREGVSKNVHILLDFFCGENMRESRELSGMLQPLRQGIRERTRVEPRESTGLGCNVDSRPSKIVLFPYFLAFALC